MVNVTYGSLLGFPTSTFWKSVCVNGGGRQRRSAHLGAER